MSGRLLSLFDVMRKGTRALGPGLRYAIWTQGCPFACPGCVTPESRAVDGGMVVDVEDLAADIMASDGIDGITISGGEPFVQAASLAALLSRVKGMRPQLNVIVFTGFAIERLAEVENAAELLPYIDLLIDGPYVETLNDGLGLRGSSNQRLHFLTDALLPYREQLENGKRQVELTFRRGASAVVGIPLKIY